MLLLSLPTLLLGLPNGILICTYNICVSNTTYNFHLMVLFMKVHLIIIAISNIYCSGVV